MIEIWQPRWHDRTVLMATYKVRSGPNKIRFIRGSLSGQEFTMDGKDIIKYPIETNGKIDCYVVPLAILSPKPEKQCSQ